MTPAAIIREAQADGVKLALSPAGSLKVSGVDVAVARWQPAIRSYKAQIIKALKTKASTSRWWRVCYCDRPPLEILYPSGAGRAAVLAAYPDAQDAHPFTPAILQPSSPLSAEEETLLRRWLAYTGETDPARIAATIDQCQQDANARKRSLEMAEDELEAFEERAAIMEFDGGLTRAEAERLAGRYPTAPAC